jgi:peptidyl-prolyl cis-trans isomerase A (cyclophilin A)
MTIPDRAKGAVLFVFALSSMIACDESAPSQEQAEGAGSGVPAAGATTTAATGTRGGRRTPPRTGVTEDGEQIIFAGTEAERSASPQRPPEERLVREPTEPDPDGGRFTLEDAVVGLPIDGDLVAEITTDFGTIFCDLYADRAPNTVANFIGLARGRRAWWDARAAVWRRQPYYAGTTFHRVIPGYIVQGGDYLGDGTGTVGYTIAYEPHETLSHDRAGRLAMATDGDPNHAGAQFYITDGPAPQLDGTATIFGQCRPDHLIARIARVPQTGSPDNRPLTPVRITRVIIQRVRGGAAQARMTVPTLPPGEPAVPRAASPGPSELRSLEGLRRRRRQAEEQLRQQRIPQ